MTSYNYNYNFGNSSFQLQLPLPPPLHPLPQPPPPPQLLPLPPAPPPPPLPPMQPFSSTFISNLRKRKRQDEVNENQHLAENNLPLRFFKKFSQIIEHTAKEWQQKTKDSQGSSGIEIPKIFQKAITEKTIIKLYADLTMAKCLMGQFSQFDFRRDRTTPSYSTPSYSKGLKISKSLSAQIDNTLLLNLDMMYQSHKTELDPSFGDGGSLEYAGPPIQYLVELAARREKEIQAYRLLPDFEFDCCQKLLENDAIPTIVSETEINSKETFEKFVNELVGESEIKTKTSSEELPKKHEFSSINKIQSMKGDLIGLVVRMKSNVRLEEIVSLDEHNMDEDLKNLSALRDVILQNGGILSKLVLIHPWDKGELNYEQAKFPMKLAHFAEGLSNYNNMIEKIHAQIQKTILRSFTVDKETQFVPLMPAPITRLMAEYAPSVKFADIEEIG